ncbi:MAG: RnfABCDGE type electron transport complex subunit D [Zetaproteobacteria bacterium]|nr:RnfABCDGE type electron transport complex subunit D [Zetaproteobacteria bacterium]
MILLSSPHIHGGNSIRKVMFSVILSLIPATLFSVYLFGWLSFLIIVSCMGAALVSEWGCLRLMKRPIAPMFDGSAALTGLLIALTLPALTPWWMTILAAMFAIILSKQIYGGLGYNPFNPALSARVILLISFPLQMTSWITPMSVDHLLNLYDFSIASQLFFFGVQSLNTSLDAITMATPLGHVKTALSQGISVPDALAHYPYHWLDAFIGNEGGSIGESSALALLLGGLFLLGKGVIRWQIPCSFLITVALLSLISSLIAPNQFAPPLFHLMAGGLMLCAFFMATDPVSSPVTHKGQLIFGIGCGLITWSIRNFGGYPEGAMFAVMLMNCAVPLIDHYTRPRVYGRAAS